MNLHILHQQNSLGPNKETASYKVDLLFTNVIIKTTIMCILQLQNNKIKVNSEKFLNTKTIHQNNIITNVINHKSRAHFSVKNTKVA